MQQPARMNLKVLLPFQVFAEKTGVSRIVAETREAAGRRSALRLGVAAYSRPGCGADVREHGDRGHQCTTAENKTIARQK